jgi:hypothetical protein
MTIAVCKIQEFGKNGNFTTKSKKLKKGKTENGLSQNFSRVFFVFFIRFLRLDGYFNQLYNDKGALP